MAIEVECADFDKGAGGDAHGRLVRDPDRVEIALIVAIDVVVALSTERHWLARKSESGGRIAERLTTGDSAGIRCLTWFALR